MGDGLVVGFLHQRSDVAVDLEGAPVATSQEYPLAQLSGYGILRSEGALERGSYQGYRHFLASWYRKPDRGVAWPLQPDRAGTVRYVARLCSSDLVVSAVQIAE